VQNSFVHAIIQTSCTSVVRYKSVTPTASGSIGAYQNSHTRGVRQ
jgi:hypothetical protein